MRPLQNNSNLNYHRDVDTDKTVNIGIQSEDKKTILYFMKLWEGIVVKNKSTCPSLFISAQETPVVTITLFLK